MDFRLYILALESGAPKTGLTLADFSVNIYRVKKSDKSVAQVVTDGDMEFEVGGSFYGYYLADISLVLYDYLANVSYGGTEILDTILWIGGDLE